jgi:hypothetical protein
MKTTTRVIKKIVQYIVLFYVIHIFHIENSNGICHDNNHSIQQNNNQIKRELNGFPRHILNSSYVQYTLNNAALFIQQNAPIWQTILSDDMQKSSDYMPSYVKNNFFLQLVIGRAMPRIMPDYAPQTLADNHLAQAVPNNPLVQAMFNNPLLESMLDYAMRNIVPNDIQQNVIQNNNLMHVNINNVPIEDIADDIDKENNESDEEKL